MRRRYQDRRRDERRDGDHQPHAAGADARGGGDEVVIDGHAGAVVEFALTARREDDSGLFLRLEQAQEREAEQRDETQAPPARVEPRVEREEERRRRDERRHAHPGASPATAPGDVADRPRVVAHASHFPRCANDRS